jgi:polyhydroxybutyrate depolymerase
VVFDFHGYAMSGIWQEALSRLPAKSDAAGFIAVHANGTGALLGWNAGSCCGTAAAIGIDDIGFVDAMLAELDTRLCVDPKRIYATGFSNGGFLSHRLGCERASVFAAIAPVAGVMGVTPCTPSRPMPVMQIHGTGDAVIPYAGNLTFEPVVTTIAGWVSRNRCNAAPVEIFHQGDVRCTATRGCHGDAEVILCTITGGGHTWPGGGFLPVGHQTTDLAATDAMWDFFVAHPLP